MMCSLRGGCGTRVNDHIVYLLYQAEFILFAVIQISHRCQFYNWVFYMKVVSSFTTLFETPAN